MGRRGGPAPWCWNAMGLVLGTGLGMLMLTSLGADRPQRPEATPPPPILMPPGGLRWDPLLQRCLRHCVLRVTL